MLILAAASAGPLSARQIAAESGVPESTLYRRLERLAEIGALCETSALDGDNNHYFEYETAIRHFDVTFEAGEAVVNAEYVGGKTRRWTYNSGPAAGD